MTELNEGNKGGFSRRTMVKGAAWSVPVIAVAAATPAAAASAAGELLVAANCPPLIGTDPASFTFTASGGTVPAGTQIVISTDGLLDLSVLPSTGGLAQVSILENGDAVYQLQADLADGESMSLPLNDGGVALSLSAAQTFTATASGAGNNSDSMFLLASVLGAISLCA